MNPNRVQEYLKCLRDIAIMKGLNEVEIRVSTPKSQLSKAGFFTSGK
ncbi:Mobile element protein [Vibrio crassostreae]|nr:Mobile element protein [Vibrio crassostreae]CAK2183268.1 Mobile element protein [Vibrio crassostreae]CAK2223054.1 Mobile element protein [Vibrio crassostreae]CAK2935474.1 Mobile element protein [Vibrio crassostreae]CAK2954365.1 Mobile element protein [Vibrio crassostreae]